MALFLRFLTSKSLIQTVNPSRFISSTSSIIQSNSTSSLTNKHKNIRNILSLLRTETNPNQILKIFKSASLTPNHHLHRIALSIAISTLSNNKHYATISHLLNDFIQNQTNRKSESYAVRAIVLYGRANLLDRSIQTFNDLNRYEIPRTVKSLNALISACLLAKDYDEAKRIYLEFPKMYGIEPDLETYNRMIRMCCESDSTSLSYAIVGDMERKWIKPTATTFGIMINGFYNEEKYDDVRNVLSMMRESNVHVGIATYNIMIGCLCKKKRSREAMALLNGVVSDRMRPNSVTYSYLIHGFCGEGNLYEAVNLFEVMVRDGYKVDSECYFTLIDCLCKGGEFEMGLILCKQSMEKNWVPSFSVMKCLVYGLASVTKVDDAKELIVKVKEKFTRNAYLWNEVEAKLEAS